MCKYNISSRTTDLNHPKHNPNEQQIQFYKKGTNAILEQTGAPIYVWLYALFIWVEIFNCLDEPFHGHRSSQEILFGATPDIN